MAEANNFISSHIRCQKSGACWYVFTKIHVFCHGFDFMTFSHISLLVGQQKIFPVPRSLLPRKVITFMALKKCWKLMVGSQSLGERDAVWLLPNHHLSCYVMKGGPNFEVVTLSQSSAFRVWFSLAVKLQMNMDEF